VVVVGAVVLVVVEGGVELVVEDEPPAAWAWVPACWLELTGGRGWSGTLSLARSCWRTAMSACTSERRAARWGSSDGRAAAWFWALTRASRAALALLTAATVSLELTTAWTWVRRSLKSWSWRAALAGLARLGGLALPPATAT